MSRCAARAAGRRGEWGEWVSSHSPHSPLRPLRTTTYFFFAQTSYIPKPARRACRQASDSTQTAAILLRNVSPVREQQKCWDLSVASKVCRFQTTRNKCQHFCGSMQTDATSVRDVSLFSGEGGGRATNFLKKALKKF